MWCRLMIFRARAVERLCRGACKASIESGTDVEAHRETARKFEHMLLRLRIHLLGRSSQGILTLVSFIVHRKNEFQDCTAVMLPDVESWPT